MKIGLDFDGVISDIAKLKSCVAMDLYGVNIRPFKFKKETVLSEKLLTQDQYKELQNIIYKTKKFDNFLEPLTGALYYVSKLVSEGHTVIVVTSRDGLSLEIAKKWSLSKGFKLDFVGVGYTNSKVNAVRGLDIYIDDDIEKIKPLVSVCKNCFLFSSVYHDTNLNIEKVKRVFSWDEFYEEISILNRNHLN